MKKKISMKTQIFWRYTALGILCFLIAVLGMATSISVEIPLILIGCAIFGAAVFSMVKGDVEDEMAKENLLKAKANTTTIMHRLLSAMGIVFLLAYALLREYDLNWVRIAAWSYYAVMGIQNVLVGLLFNKWEAE